MVRAALARSSQVQNLTTIVKNRPLEIINIKAASMTYPQSSPLTQQLNRQRSTHYESRLHSACRLSGGGLSLVQPAQDYQSCRRIIVLR